MPKIDIIVPTFYAKRDILLQSVSENVKLLTQKEIDFTYIVVVDFHELFDCQLAYYNINRISSRVNLYFKYNQTTHKESFRAINFGCCISKAANMVIMDDDYIVSEEYLDLLCKNMEKPVFCSSFLRKKGELFVAEEVSMDANSESMTIGSGIPKFLSRITLFRNGLYDEQFVGYTFCDNEFSRRYCALENKLVIDGAKFGITHLEHDHYLHGAKVDVQTLHLQYIDQNRKMFVEGRSVQHNSSGFKSSSPRTSSCN